MIFYAIGTSDQIEKLEDALEISEISSHIELSDNGRGILTAKLGDRDGLELCQTAAEDLGLSCSYID